MWFVASCCHLHSDQHRPLNLPCWAFKSLRPGQNSFQVTSHIRGVTTKTDPNITKHEVLTYIVQDSTHSCKADLLLRSTLINRSQQWLYLTQQQHAVHHLSSPWRRRRKCIHISDKLGQSMYREGITFGSTDTCLMGLTYFSVYVGHTRGSVEESSSWDGRNSGKRTKKKPNNMREPWPFRTDRPQ